MQPRESRHLKPGAPVWIWVVRLAKGRWWPGTVQSLGSFDNQPRATVRFECRSVNAPNKAPVIVGVTTTAMRYLELRDVQLDGVDRPRYTPVSLLERPEESDVANAQQQQTRSV